MLDLSKIHSNEKVRGALIKRTGEASYIAKLAEQTPVDLTTNTVLAFNNFAGCELVGESQPKSNTPVETESFPVLNAKLVAQERVTREVLNMGQQEGVDFLGDTFKLMADSMGYNFDISATHTTSPKSGNLFAPLAYGVARGSQAQVDVYDPATEKLADKIIDAIYESLDSNVEMNGIAVSNRGWAALAKATNAAGFRLYPQFNTLSPTEDVMFEGVRIVRAPAIAHLDHLRTKPSGVDAVVGDWTQLKFGMKLDPFTLIPYGDPDGLGYDVARYNQVVVRAEADIQYVITHSKAFTVIKTA